MTNINIANVKIKKNRSLLRIKTIKRYPNENSGATAIEFGLIAFPFLALLAAIIETALVLYAGQILETAVSDTGRLIMTGQIQASENNTESGFRQELCNNIFTIIDCNNVEIDVQNYGTNPIFNNDSPVDDDGNLDTSSFGYNAGAGGDIIVVRAVYEWPVFFPFLGLDTLSNGNRLLTSTTTFKNEPF